VIRDSTLYYKRGELYSYSSRTFPEPEDRRGQIPLSYGRVDVANEPADEALVPIVRNLT
jgi:hypothetical protein